MPCLGSIPGEAMQSVLELTASTRSFSPNNGVIRSQDNSGSRNQIMLTIIATKVYDIV